LIESDHPQLSIRRFGDIPLCRWLTQLWPAIEQTSQPYQLATSQGTLWQVPDNAGLVDYTTVDELMSIFESNATRWQANRSKPQIITTGFHQETARKFLSRLDEAIPLMRRLATERDWPLVFTARPREFLA